MNRPVLTVPSCMTVTPTTTRNSCAAPKAAGAAILPLSLLAVAQQTAEVQPSAWLTHSKPA
jgi:hypothetical protein